MKHGYRLRRYDRPNIKGYIVHFLPPHHSAVSSIDYSILFDVTAGAQITLCIGNSEECPVRCFMRIMTAAALYFIVPKEVIYIRYTSPSNQC